MVYKQNDLRTLNLNFKSTQNLKVQKMNKNNNIEELYNVISKLRSKEEVELFLTDLCTPTELSAMADRWKAVKMLNLGIPYREIYEKTGVSTATVTRVARCLSFGSGGYKLLLERTKNENLLNTLTEKNTTQKIDLKKTEPLNQPNTNLITDL